MADTAPAFPTRTPFNPGWLALALSVIIGVAGIGSTMSDVSDLKSEVKELQAWKGGQEVAISQLKQDVGYIKDTVKDIRTVLMPSPAVYNYPAPAPSVQRRAGNMPRRAPAHRARPRRPSPVPVNSSISR